MAAPLTGTELRLLADIEHRLRRSDPDLDRLLSRRPGPIGRLAWQPRALVLAVAVLATAVAALAVAAGAGTTVAAVPAALGLLALAAVFRRLARLQRR